MPMRVEEELGSLGGLPQSDAISSEEQVSVEMKRRVASDSAEENEEPSTARSTATPSGPTGIK